MTWSRLARGAPRSEADRLTRFGPLGGQSGRGGTSPTRVQERGMATMPYPSGLQKTETYVCLRDRPGRALLHQRFDLLQLTRRVRADALEALVRDDVAVLDPDARILILRDGVLHLRLERPVLRRIRKCIEHRLAD